MLNFIAKFAPNISDVTAPLRELIKKNVAFRWLETHEKAFRDLQHLLTDPATLRYYDVAGPVTLQVDASQNGLGAALIQNQGPVAYASKAMNDTQRADASHRSKRNCWLLFSPAKDSISTFMVKPLLLKVTTNLWKLFSKNPCHKHRVASRKC